MSYSKDEDRSRLPEGMVRIGYDADKQRYQFHDRNDDSLWEGPEGSYYGKLRRVSTSAPGGPDAKMFNDSTTSSPVQNVRRQSAFSASPTSSGPTDFDQILGNMGRERSASLQSAGSSNAGAAMIGSAIKRSATVTSKFTRRLSRQVSRSKGEPLLEESRRETKEYETHCVN